jgi:hypothetical protein
VEFASHRGARGRDGDENDAGKEISSKPHHLGVSKRSRGAQETLRPWFHHHSTFAGSSMGKFYSSRSMGKRRRDMLSLALFSIPGCLMTHNTSSTSALFHLFFMMIGEAEKAETIGV